ncbi:putative pyridine nucleotide-disulfide oxidoreductase RclA [Fusobacterium sp. DD29]|uniref:FAD-dependent oxidoreductase n=1 Tax=unclassified Fusobacterium TaxID=2648384 RepID=UPI001B8B9C3A|nr:MULTISPECIES: FAD-dependent oxidoreductase [unclassified Fusobacterium]MBR8702193.1 putative pyridine nucleotide-disulfide oxidoreductase RclA [Fusobacterium sp. DD45]MBR8712016.1 putative pyridine nucleotide-disulfide oxidoreductase RclA [Fusobacterium sp. DD28]MBR8749859.1 putative pyridine nucleotide-disulfide oxidoreductase RclA [Fusobacterium sp. DD29]MBR8752590.1 putative pyridine nucleotide-disulfide oxidoreductase RclA [Fusobacterium sp. DD26]MBR8762101.1 putative pyridine nucleotid
MKKYDAVIIGFGKGGKTLAGDMANRGFKVAVVEKSNKMYGGTCINVGCIPTKYLILEAAKNKYKNLTSFVQFKEEYRQIIDNKINLISALRKKNFDNLDTKENVDVINGEGSFVDANTIEVKTENETFRIQGDKIFINTGAETVYPPIKGLKESRYVYDSEAIMELKELPKHLVIVGGGYIGLEYAGMYKNFGSRVTVLEGSPLFMPREDREIADEVLNLMSKKGISINLGVKVVEIDQDKVIYEKDGKRETVEADAILIAVGRKPNTNNLKLENAGVKVNERGAVVVDDRLHTSQENIWALGDVHGGLQFTYTSLDDYRIVRSELFGKGDYTLKDRKVVPYTVFLEPQFSRVGMTEEEARKNGYEVKTAKMAAASPRLKIAGEAEGLLKVVVDAKTDKILGASLLIAQSGELINTIALAIKAGVDYKELRDGIYTHPTVSEIFNDLFAGVR